MTLARTRAFCIIGALAIASVVAPAAQAGSQPVYLFLRDAALPSAPNVPPCMPRPSGTPTGDGELTEQAPCPLDLVAPQNNSAPQSRVVPTAAHQVHPTQFIMLNQSLNTGHIYGPIIILLYVPESPAVLSGNLSVQLVALPSTYAVTDVGATGDVLAGATIDLAYHNTTMPEPTTLVPPDPTNATAAAAYLAGQLLVYGLTELSKAQYIMFLDDDVKDNIVNKLISQDAKLALRFSLLASTTPAPVPLPLPVAQGAGQPILYNFALTPALVYVPWFIADPIVDPNAPPPPTTTTCPGCSPSETPSQSGSSTDNQKSGAPESVFVLAVLALALFIRRRR